MAASDASTGKKDNSEEYAAPFAMPKQLSS